MAKDAGSPLLTAHLWTLVGLSIVPGCFGWLWAAKRWVGFALPDGEFAGAGYLCAAYSRQRLASLAYHQQSWFWRYLYGHDISGDDYRPPTERTGKSQSF
ncbi:putative permease [Escherichia coli]|uniref:Putative permease n=1 Tax=Escherichia coli TaxID=562 RepID=A0A376LI23_ECOLX|nr:putative permease [Escherichia coli]